MFYHFNFETNCNFDQVQMEPEADHKKTSMPTTANNSPGSVKSFDSFQAELHHECDVSFEEGTQVNHANNIWKASCEMLAQSLYKPTNVENGFNNDSVYKYSCFSQQSDNEWKTIDEAIKGNRLLRYREKVNFIEELQKETELCGLLVELMMLFNARIFGEIVYVVYTIWNKKYLKYREERKQNTKNVIPAFNCFYGFQDEEVELERASANEYKEAKEIKARSEEIEDLVRQLFASKKLKYLNFQEIKGEKVSGMMLIDNFEVFVKAVSKAVFLSAEGIYEEEGVSVGSFSEQEEGLFGESENRFVRAYS